MDNQIPTRSSRRQLGRICLAIALIVSAIALLVRSQNSRAEREFDAIRKAGYPVTLAEWNDWYQAVPGHENAALKILDACRQWVSPVGSDKFPGVGISVSGRNPVAPEHRSLLTQFLTNNQSALALVHEAAGLPKSRYPIDLNQGFNVMLPHLSEVKRLAQQLRNVALLHSDDGRPELALQSYTDALAAARSLAGEPTLISQLVRIACIAIAQTALEHLLSQHPLTAEQLETLSVQLRDTETVSRDGFTRGVVGERCAGISVFQMRPYHLVQLAIPGLNTQQTSWFAMMSSLQRATGVWDRDFRFFREILQLCVESLQLPFPKALEQSQAADRRFVAGIQGFNRYLRPVSAVLLPAMHKATVKEAANCARLRAAQISVAIELHRLRNNGDFPQDLSQLPPTLVRSVSRDPFTDKPFRFKRLEPGYVVYSVGDNGRDDGGDPKLDVAFRVER